MSESVSSRGLVSEQQGVVHVDVDGRDTTLTRPHFVPFLPPSSEIYRPYVVFFRLFFREGRTYRYFARSGHRVLSPFDLSLSLLRALVFLHTLSLSPLFSATLSPIPCRKYLITRSTGTAELI